MKKNQNRITEYRKMFQAWKEAGIVTYAGFIMGLPGDTPETIKRDIEIVQKELPVDLLEFTMLTPLPGSEDHQKLYEKGVWMDPDLNKYDLETVTVEHPSMSREEWQQTYRDVWNWYYTDEHVETMMRRNIAYGIKPVRIVRSVLQIYGAPHFEEFIRSNAAISGGRTARSAGPSCRACRRSSSIPATPGRRSVKYARFGLYGLKLHRMRKRLQKDDTAKAYRDLAITPVVDAEGELSRCSSSTTPPAPQSRKRAARLDREQKQPRDSKNDGLRSAAPHRLHRGGKFGRCLAAPAVA